MTSNRAHKRAARAIAAEQNIRFPEALPMADDKTEPALKVPHQHLDPANLQKVRILFARRYADLIAAGVEEKKTLDLLASSLATVPGLGGKTLAAAISEVRTMLTGGSSPAIAWASCENLLGVHLYHMLQVSHGMGGSSPKILRAAAETMESELRLGVF